MCDCLLQCASEHEIDAALHTAWNASPSVDMTSRPTSDSSVTWICVPRNLPNDVRLEHGACWNDAQPLCAEPHANSTLLYWKDACEERRYSFNGSQMPCGGACESRLFVFKTCEPETNIEWLMCLLYSIAGAELTYCIFSALAEVLRGFRMREIAVRYLLELTPHPGTQSRFQQDTFGLLPKFDLDRVENIVAWNRMRIVLQTWDSDNFKVRQGQAAFPVMLLLAVLLAVAFKWFAPPTVQRYISGCWWMEDIRSFQQSLPWRFQYKDETVDPALTSISIKLMLMQLLGSFLTFCIVSSGGSATRLFETEVPQVMLLKKAELQLAGLPTVGSLLFSCDVELEIWCNLGRTTEPEQTQDTRTLRQFLIAHKLHQIVAQVAVRHVDVTLRLHVAAPLSLIAGCGLTYV